MSRNLKGQVVVVTGSSSGIGLATAKLAAAKRAKLVLVSRNESALKKICQELRGCGGEAIYVVADVSREEDVNKISNEAVSRFGRIDTWVNNVGISSFGNLIDIPIEEQKRIFDVNFWGMVYGCRAAVKAMRGHGGLIINIGSAVSERAIAMQGIYSASKQALKAYSDALRLELSRQKIPVEVSVIMPGPINSPFLSHAGNHMDFQPSFPPPVYATKVAAKAVVACMERPRRQLFVGGGARAHSALETISPWLADLYANLILFEEQKSQRKKEPGEEDNIFTPPSEEGRIDGDRYEGIVFQHSLYTAAALHPVRALVAGLAILGIPALFRVVRDEWQAEQGAA